MLHPNTLELRSTMPRRTLLRKAALALAAAGTLAAVPSAALAQSAPPTDRPVIRTQAELPRYTYELPTATASALLSDPAFDGLAARVRADLEALLGSYVIEDRATLRSLHGTLESLALLRGDHDAAIAHAAEVRSLEEKPAERLTSGLLTGALVAAMQAGGDEAARLAAFREVYASAIQALPWEVVREAVKQRKAQTEIFSPNLLLGLAQSQYDPAASETRRISGDVARDLIGWRQMIEVTTPFRELIIEVLQAYIDANHVQKPDIWAARDVAFTGAETLHPVVIGIWDTGVDAAVFGERMFRNPGESASGRDDDGNGFVDDLHGIAYGLWGAEPAAELLLPLDAAARARLPEMREQLKGLGDVRANLDSPEARALKRQIAGMQPEQVQPFIEELSLFSVYVHGTHVAGIAAAGNPAARILVVRETFPHQMIPPPLLRADAESWAASFRRTVEYLDRHGARVVNMSWGTTAKDLEGAYEVNGIGASAEERQEMAREAFAILMDGMREAMRSAPGILFVPAAGNTSEDINFIDDMPAAIELPNVLSVGAVDQAGEETTFTSYGRTVRAHASGFEVESYLPGGERLPLSGTSMAAPNVVNLAGKLLAVDPSLTPEAVVALILEAADRSEDGRRVLINPKRSLELLAARRTR